MNQEQLKEMVMHQHHTIMLFSYGLAILIGVLLFVILSRKSEFVPIRGSVKLSKGLIFILCVGGTILVASIPFIFGFLFTC